MQALHNKGGIMKQTSLPGLEYASFHSSTWLGIPWFGLEKFVPAAAYHSSLNMPAPCSQPRTSIMFGPNSVKGNGKYQQGAIGMILLKAARQPCSKQG